MAGNTVRILVAAKDEISSTLDKIRDKAALLSKTDIGKGMLQGAGIAAFGAVKNAAFGALGAVTDFAAGSIRAASDLAETVSKSSVIFGQSADKISAWADTMGKAGGLSKRAALDAASGFAGLFQTVGLAGDKSAEMSVKLTQMGADLASFFNTDVDSALQALKSGLNGESEPLRRFNVFLSETAVTAKLGQMGIAKVGGAFTEAQKATARYQLILDQTGSAQGDFARTADGLANSSRITQAEMENLSAEVGEKLLPIMRELTIWARDDGVPALEGVIGAADTLGIALRSMSGNAGKALDFLTPWDGVDNAIGKSAKTFGRLKLGASDLTGAVKSAARAHQEAAAGVDAFGSAASGARPKASSLSRTVAKLADGFQDLDKWAKTVGDTLAAAAYGPEELRLAFSASKLELVSNQRELDKLTDEFATMERKGKKPTLAQKQHMLELQTAVNTSKQEVIKLGTELETTGGISMADLKTQLTKLGIPLDHLKGTAADLWRYLQLISDTNRGTAYDNSPKGRGGHGKATGGFIPAGTGDWVGEGPGGKKEWAEALPGGGVVIHPMDSSAYGLGSGPRTGGSGPGGASGAPAVLQINVNGVQVFTPGAAQQLAALIAPAITSWQQSRRVFGTR